MPSLLTQMVELQSQMQALNERVCELHKEKLKVLVALESRQAYQDLLKVNVDINQVQTDWQIVWSAYMECKEKLNASKI